MKYILGFFITILLIILLVVLLVSGGRKKEPVPNTSKALPEYSNTESAASLSIAGPINYYQEHRTTKITVGRDVVTLEQIRGYDGEVIDAQTFSNTEKAYGAFLSALERAGFTKGNSDKELQDDLGRCALGTRYIYEFEDSGKRLQRFWSVSCKGPESYQGNETLTIKLFKAQVPKYEQLNNTFSANLRRQANY